MQGSYGSPTAAGSLPHGVNPPNGVNYLGQGPMPGVQGPMPGVQGPMQVGLQGSGFQMGHPGQTMNGLNGHAGGQNAPMPTYENGPPHHTNPVRPMVQNINPVHFLPTPQVHTHQAHQAHQTGHQSYQMPHQMPLQIRDQINPNQAPGTVPSGPDVEDPLTKVRYRPCDPTHNLSTVTLVPSLDHSSETHVKVSNRKLLNEFEYLGPSSCVSHFRGDGDEKLPPKPGQRKDTKYAPTFKGSSHLSPEEVSVELQILQIRKAFCLPLHELCLVLFEAFFTKVYPLCPVVNKQIFLEHFNHANPQKRPPLLLTFSILMAATRACVHPAILDKDGSSLTASKILCERMKALYHLNVVLYYDGETDDVGQLAFAYPTVLTTCLALFPFYWDIPGEPARGPCFWIREAISIAMSYGFHRSSKYMYQVAQARFKDLADVKPFHIRQQCFYWRKMFWCLFIRDKTTGLCYGRPPCLNIQDVDLEMLAIHDFITYELGWTSSKEDYFGADYLIHQIKLAEITAVVWNEQYLLWRESYREDSHRRHQVVVQFNKMMAQFFQQLPHHLKFDIHDKDTENVFLAALGMHYYSVLYHINRLSLAAGKSKNRKNVSWGIAFQAAFVMSLIATFLVEERERDPVMLFPTFSIYTTALAAIVLSLHIDSSNKIVALAAARQTSACLAFIQEWHKRWPGITYTLLTFFTDQLGQNEKRNALAEKARGLWKKIHHTSRALGKLRASKTVDINFLLNSEGQDDMLTSDEELDDRERKVEFTLPAYQMRTLKFEHDRDFDATMLFSKRDKKGSPGSSKSLSPEPEGETASPEAEEGFPPEMMNLFEFNPSHPPFQAGLLYGKDVSLYDSLYFLNLSSGIEWSSYSAEGEKR